VVVTPRLGYQVSSAGFNDEDLREYISEPVAALPPAITPLLPPITLLLVPYLERVNGGSAGTTKENGSGRTGGVVVAEVEPAEGRWVPYVSFPLPGGPASSGVVIALGVEGQETADYHYHLYHELALLAVDKLAPETVRAYSALVAEELRAGAHGEVDDESWAMKRSVRRHGSAAKPSKAFSAYARASLVDTLTLYLHGICCDIDVEPGPRQLPSRHLRKRLKLLQQLLPAPKGYAVFPEELDAMPPGTDARLQA
jgi:hypothetical protein